MPVIPVLLLLGASVALMAAETAPEVLRIDGVDISARDLEDELLRQEGAERLRTIIKSQLTQLDWRRLADADPICVLAGQPLTRGQIVAPSFQAEAAGLRKKLANVAMVGWLLDQDGAPQLTDAMLEAEFRRKERTFQRRLGEARTPDGTRLHVSFAEYLASQPVGGKEAYLAQPELRMEARMHARVVAISSVPEDELRRTFAKDPQRFGTTEAVSLSVIYQPFQTLDLDGNIVIDPQSRRLLPKTMRNLRGSIAKGRTQFARAWELAGKASDPENAGGVLGWVDQDGRPELPSRRPQSAAVMQAVFAADLRQLPLLIDPVIDEQGVSLVRIDAHRRGQMPKFEAVKDVVRQELVEARIDQFTKAYIGDLMQIHKPDLKKLAAQQTDRRIKDYLLERSGEQAALALLDAQLASIDWAALADADEVLSLPALGQAPERFLRRIDLVVPLLKDHGADVRDDLMRIFLVRRALDKAGIAPTEAVLAREWARTDPKVRKEYDGTGGKPDRTELLAQEGFRLAACLHEYVRRSAIVLEDDLMAFYADRRERYAVAEAVDLAVIHAPYQTLGVGKQAIVDQAHAAQVHAALDKQRQILLAGDKQFAEVWALYGRTVDPRATGGAVGWVERDGGPERGDVADLPPLALAEAFAASRKALPVLLPVVKAEAEALLIEVRGYRPAKQPSFQELREQIRLDYIEYHLPRITMSMSNDFIRAATIEWGELHKLLERRDADRLRGMEKAAPDR